MIKIALTPKVINKAELKTVLLNQKPTNVKVDFYILHKIKFIPNKLSGIKFIAHYDSIFKFVRQDLQFNSRHSNKNINQTYQGVYFSSSFLYSCTSIYDLKNLLKYIKKNSFNLFFALHNEREILLCIKLLKNSLSHQNWQKLKIFLLISPIFKTNSHPDYDEAQLLGLDKSQHLLKYLKNQLSANNLSKNQINKIYPTALGGINATNLAKLQPLIAQNNSHPTLKKLYFKAFAAKNYFFCTKKSSNINL